jgi:hypothetical protein
VEQNKKKTGMLTLGWQVTPFLAPRYWLKTGAIPGGQPDQDLVHVPAASMGCHAAIVAQSGSGKSFFLGRLIEELLLETKARCVILDPNADFRRIADVVPEERWTSARYDPQTSRGFLPHEPTHTEFTQKWKRIRKRLAGGPQLSDGGEQIRLSWPSLSVEFISTDAPQGLRPDLYHCHEFVKAVARLIELKELFAKSDKRREGRKDESEEKDKPRVDLIDQARRILARLRGAGTSSHERREILVQEFDPEVIVGRNRHVTDQPFPRTLMGFYLRFPDMAVSLLNSTIDQAVAAVDYFSLEAEKFYFGKAREYVAQNIVHSSVEASAVSSDNSVRLEVFDLPSFPELSTRLLALNSILASEWENARAAWEAAMERPDSMDQRVPTFIVLDEAHNLIPESPRDLAATALREQFRTIAAEGRKFGLFLILCTQRPDKIDKLVLSECENRAVMKLGSRSVLDITQKLFGLEDVPAPLLGKCLEFETGRALLIGPWAAAGPGLLYTAMRRTKEGGRGLAADHWAASDPDLGVRRESPGESPRGRRRGHRRPSKHR